MAYSGLTANIPLGQIGLLTDVPPSDVPRGALIKANNISYETGLVTKAPGAAVYNLANVTALQAITASAALTSGEYTINWDGYSTSSLTYSSNAATIQTALRLIPGLASVTVSGSFTTGNLIVVVTFTGYSGSPSLLTITPNTTGKTFSIVTTVAGVSGSGPLPAGVIAIHDWWPNVTTQRMIAACSDGAIYRDIGDRNFSGNTPIAEDLLSLTPRCQFVEGGQETASAAKKLFFFSDGMNQLKVLEGDDDEFTSVTSPASDWTTPRYPKFGFIHRNRLWAFRGSRGYASDTADHENFTSNHLAYNIFPGEGGELIGGHVFKGRAFVFKQGGFVYYLDDTDADSDNWVFRKLASNFGLASPHGIVEVINDMIAVNESGSPISYNAVNALGDIESADLLRLLQIENFYKRNTSLAGLEYTHAVYYEAKKQAFFTTRTTYRTTNDCLLHLDFNKENTRAALWTKDQANCLALRKDTMSAGNILKPFYGAEDGFIYLMDQEDRDTDGASYTGEFKTGHMDFRWMDERIAQKNKLFDFIAVEFKPQGSWNVSCDVYIDGSFVETINFLMDVRDDGLDDFTLDTDALGREETQTVHKPLHGSGRRISLHFYGEGDDQNFAIASLTVGFRPSAEQHPRV